MEIFMDLETFVNLIQTEIYFHNFSKQSLIDAYNHIQKQDDGTYKCNINGIRIKFNEVGEILNVCTKLHPVVFGNNMVGTKNHKLEIEMREKGVYYE